MCGIVGIWDYKNKVSESLLKEMRDTLRHRGPDDEGIFLDERQNVGLGFRRLSIIDLSEGGHQPMERDDLVAIYNGEIYNYLEIKKELEGLGVKFTSSSDTEVMIYAFRQWGEEAVHKFRGMFALGLWDKREEELTLYRDRAGVKPLYYYSDYSKFIFASEIKAIIKHPQVSKDLDFDALANFFKQGFIPSPLSAFKNIYKLEPGHLLRVDKNGVITKKKYWDLNDFALKEDDSQIYNEEEVLRKTEDLLTEAFNLRMVADVPVGMFLSGGIDSALVVALLKKNPQNIVNTFTIGFKEEGYDEAEHAKSVAKHLGTNHHELYITPEKVMSIVSRLPEIYDEPLADASAIPTYLVSEFARSEVTVALSADGGDELFCGYGNQYTMVEQAYRKYRDLPRFLGSLARTLPNLFGQSTRVKLLISQNNLAGTYAALQKESFSNTEVIRLLNNKANTDYAEIYWKHFEALKEVDPISQQQLFDFRTHMTDNILAKVDRASMATSLECREPFLDPYVMQYAVSLPTALKRKNNTDKYILRNILYKYVPRELVDRPKQGFGMPIGELLKKDLRYLIDEYLDEEKIKKEGILNPDIVRKEKEDFLTHKVHVRALWRLIVFQMWKEHWDL